jgi:putative flippase GtrA
MQFLRFVLVQVGASGLHTAGVWLLTRFLGLPYPASKLVVAALVYLGWNYPKNRWVVFNPRFARRA